jgi:hypothetical protein
MGFTEKAILTTILYSDIFDFPLTKDELWQFLISKKSISKSSFEEGLAKLGRLIIYKDGYYCLIGKERNITKRKKNNSQVQKKTEIAIKATYYLSYIPTIRFIGLSGGLAMGDADKWDDIDLFLITQKHSLFTTRLFVLVLLELMNLRRKRSDKKASDKICVNLLIEETNLRWPISKRDIYTAREIVQVKPLFERKGTYKQFLTSNGWVEEFLPNSLKVDASIMGKTWKRNYYSLAGVSSILMSRPIELLMKKFQKRYIQLHQTTETVKDTVLAFHPKDYRSNVLTLLNLKLQQFGLLTKV